MKGVVLTTVGSSLLCQAVARGSSMPHTLRPLARAFAFGNMGELIFGVGLLYYFRLLERLAGTGKFGGFAFTTGALSYGLQLGLQAAYRLRRGMPTGPYGLIFASFVPFILDVPPTSRFTVCGLQMTDKAFVYLAGIQLILSSGVGSTMAAVCGLMAGLTYRANLFGMKQFRFPRWLSRFFSATLGRLLDARGNTAPRVQIYVPRNQQQIPLNSGGHVPRQMQQPHPSPSAVEPSQEAIAQLMGMGFDQERALWALQAANNDVEVAINMLVG
ncbi:unnamed protein product [Ostreobium quekettii]|uniref:UBA domain-containing protein n=1 Tax=Ostreobium quekettii TaxID=121088 RepID=A0A8S1IVL5_9CHLO|nr:unnamed protein product [Ostreobium quekettii]